MVFAKGTFAKLSKEENEEDINDSWLILNVMDAFAKETGPECQALAIRAEEREQEYLVHTGSVMAQSECCHSEIDVMYKDGDAVCSACGRVQPVPIYVDPFSMSNTFIQNCIFQSSYKRIHYCNERIYQWLCRDAWQMHPVELKELRIIIASYTPVTAKPAIMDGCVPTPHAPPSFTKTRIRMGLRKMGRPKFIEKWVTIQCQLTKEQPPNPDDELVETMRKLFLYVEVAFNRNRPENRKSMIHYNFVFVRIFQFLNKPEYFKFFPLLKSKAKVRALDQTWKKMTDHLGWKYLPLPSSKAFKI